MEGDFHSARRCLPTLCPRLHVLGSPASPQSRLSPKGVVSGRVRTVCPVQLLSLGRVHETRRIYPVHPGGRGDLTTQKRRRDPSDIRTGAGGTVGTRWIYAGST